MAGIYQTYGTEIIQEDGVAKVNIYDYAAGSLVALSVEDLKGLAAELEYELRPKLIEIHRVVETLPKGEGMRWLNFLDKGTANWNYNRMVRDRKSAKGLTVLPVFVTQEEYEQIEFVD